MKLRFTPPSHGFAWPVFVLILLLSSMASILIIHAATPPSGTLSETSSSVTWSGSTTSSDVVQTGSGVFNPTDCTTAGYCDTYSLDLSLSPSTGSAEGYTMTVSINWASGADDYDLYVYLAGSQVGASTLGSGTEETVVMNSPPPGTYTVYAVMSLGTTAPPYPYVGTATLAFGGSGSGSTLRGNYIDTGSKFGNQQFSFSNDLRLQGAGYSTSSTTGSGQDVEPDVQVSSNGTIFVAAIQGVPAGVDFWKSTDGGNTFQYMGQPDGTQCATCTQNTSLAAVGGGDEDLKLSSNGTLYLASLWLGSSTFASSSNGGTRWTDSQSPIPEQDRPWIAAVGPSTVYLYTHYLGGELSGTDNLVLTESTNGGLTFTQGAAITFPTDVNSSKSNPQTNTHGPLTTGPDGSLYTVFSDSAQDLWLMKCPAPCNLPLLPGGLDSMGPIQIHMIYNATAGPVKITSSVFPDVAVDSAGNLYVTFSDGNNVYLITSTDGGAVWDTPVQVNHGQETVTAVLPWEVAGSPGRLGIFWYGSNSTIQFSGQQWKAFYAFSPDAQTSTPTFYQVVVSGGGAIGTNGVDHVGAICLMGLTCNLEGANRNLAEYSYVNVDPRTGLVDLSVSTDVNTPDGLAWQDFIKQSGGFSLFAPTPPVTITGLTSLNGQGQPQSVFAPGQILEVKLGISVATSFSGTGLVGVQVSNANGQTITMATEKTSLLPGSDVVTYEFVLPSGMPAGDYTITGFVWNGFPSQKGPGFAALASPVTATVQVT